MKVVVLSVIGLDTDCYAEGASLSTSVHRTDEGALTQLRVELDRITYGQAPDQVEEWFDEFWSCEWFEIEYGSSMVYEVRRETVELGD
jgi:hypothetical protein